MQTLNGKPALDNTADLGLKTASTVSLSGESEIWVFCVIGASSGNDNILLETSTNSNTNNGAIIINFETTTRVTVSMKTTLGAALRKFNITQGTQNLLTVQIKTNTDASLAYNAWLNGTGLTEYSVGAISTENFTNQTINIGARNASSFRYNSKIQEVIIFGGDQSANRTGIEANINTYYGIY